MSRPLEDILFGAPSPQAQTIARVMSVIDPVKRYCRSDAAVR